MKVSMPRVRQTLRTADKERTRAHLLATAVRLFCENGIGPTRMGDIAAAAGVAHGTVFLHFATRAALVLEVVRAQLRPVAVRLHDVAGAGKTVQEVLLAHVEALAEHEMLYARVVAELPTLPEEVRGVVIGIQSAIAKHLGLAVEREIAAGKLRPVVPALLFNTWIGLVNHYVINRDLFAPGGSALRRHGAELVAHLLALLRL